METHLLTLTFQECSTRYGLGPADLQEFLQAGLLRLASTPETIIVDEPDDLPRLARLHYELGLSPEALDIVLTMRQRLVRLQARLEYETARARQLENFVRGAGPLLEG
ncbi:chaperone modulator CbpM [Hymenobacter sp. BT770]|jgi:chaperone modulatory protein CbpM|uniref:chaperone modulator CbpM n=1 Tax=Hymenobacter sp. BT770 TaxID=2886942 RepID=UPI001D0FA7DD|nr:chaperone modulator CbpM [Hymenobacter sp. BT770]MCC3154123.1 chaperone modulator CbpM [Hymenobacter sp. BT770]MDO3414430.1 chaperone modulator CbpM [Hymenobacter sp. BT770]